MNDNAKLFKQKFCNIIYDLIWDKYLSDKDKAEVLAYAKKHVDANLIYYNYTNLAKFLDEVKKEKGIK